MERHIVEYWKMVKLVYFGANSNGGTIRQSKQQNPNRMIRFREQFWMECWDWTWVLQPFQESISKSLLNSVKKTKCVHIYISSLVRKFLTNMVLLFFYSKVSSPPTFFKSWASASVNFCKSFRISLINASCVALISPSSFEIAWCSDLILIISWQSLEGSVS